QTQLSFIPRSADWPGSFFCQRSRKPAKSGDFRLARDCIVLAASNKRPFRMKVGRFFLWVGVACAGAAGLAILATARGEDEPNVLWFIVAAVCVYAFAYRFYSSFIARRVLELDDR